MFTDGTTTYSCDTLVAGLILQSTPIDWWCLYWIHGDMDPSIYNGTGLQRLQAFRNLIRDVGADNGDGYNRVDVFLPGGEAELDSSWGDDLRDGEGASPFVVKLLHGAIGGVILEA